MFARLNNSVVNLYELIFISFTLKYEINNHNILITLQDSKEELLLS